MSKQDLIPIAVETLGTMGQAGQQIIKDVANVAFPVDWYTDSEGHRRLVDWDGLRAVHIRNIRQHLMTVLQRENANVIRMYVNICVRGAPPVLSSRHSRAHAAAADTSTQAPTQLQHVGA